MNSEVNDVKFFPLPFEEEGAMIAGDIKVTL